MDLIAAIESRRSTREFLEKEVDVGVVKEVIRLGTMAPTACNRQGWRFIIISDKGVKEKISGDIGSPIINRSPLGVLVLYNKFTINTEYPDNVESASACIQNMLLAAATFGLGTCWVNHLRSKSRVRQVLRIPKRYDVIAYVAFGYPKNAPSPVPRKYLNVDELISCNVFRADIEIEKRRLSIISLKVLNLLRKNRFIPRSWLWLRKLRAALKGGIFKVDHD